MKSAWPPIRSLLSHSEPAHNIVFKPTISDIMNFCKCRKAHSYWWSSNLFSSFWFVLVLFSSTNDQNRRQLRIVHWDIQLSLLFSQLLIYLWLVATNSGINEIFRAWKQISIYFAEENETLQSPWILPASPGNIMPEVWRDTIVWIQLKPRAWWSDPPLFDNILTVSQFSKDINDESPMLKGRRFPRWKGIIRD